MICRIGSNIIITQTQTYHSNYAIFSIYIYLFFSLTHKHTHAESLVSVCEKFNSIINMRGSVLFVGAEMCVSSTSVLYLYMYIYLNVFVAVAIIYQQICILTNVCSMRKHNSQLTISLMCCVPKWQTHYHIDDNNNNKHQCKAENWACFSV